MFLPVFKMSLAIPKTNKLSESDTESFVLQITPQEIQAKKKIATKKYNLRAKKKRENLTEQWVKHGTKRMSQHDIELLENYLLRKYNIRPRNVTDKSKAP